MTGILKPRDGEPASNGWRVAIVAAQFNGVVVDKLLRGALETLRTGGVREADVTVVRVPGAFEIPLAAMRLATGRHQDAVIALGAVIRGETPHFDYVAAECVRGLMEVMLETGVPVLLGVLTCDTAEQALERAGGKAGNKGADAARAALDMAALCHEVA